MFNYCPSMKLDPNLFSASITAILALGQSLTKLDLHQMTLGDHFLVMVKDLDTELLFIGEGEKSVGVKNLLTALGIIQERFKKKYKDALAAWTGNVFPFSNFEEDIKELFYDKTDKTKEMW